MDNMRVKAVEEDLLWAAAMTAFPAYVFLIS